MSAPGNPLASPAPTRRTWVGTIYEDELMPEMTDAEYDEWYARSYIVDGVRVGPLTREYKLKQLLAIRKQTFEELEVYDLEIEKLLDEQVAESRKRTTDDEQHSRERAAFDFLSYEGYRPCDDAACNCGSWHKRDLPHTCAYIPGEARCVRCGVLRQGVK